MPMLNPPLTVEEFHHRLAELAPELPRRLRQCADHIAANGDRIAVSTVAELAIGADVPPSAVMRFCQIMGYSGFSEMQKMFRDAYAPGFPDYSTRLANLKQGGAGSPSALLAEFVEAGRLSLEALAKSADEAALARAIDLLVAAQTVHIIGLRRAFPVATYMAYVFEKMGVSAILHDGVGALDHRHSLRAGDAVLAISFAPYSSETIAIAAEAEVRGLAVVALTDSLASPLARSATAILMVPEVDFGAFRALSATLAMAMTLAVAVGSRQK